MPNFDCELNAISPLDGRYRSKLNAASEELSEASLIRNRVKVEVLWLRFLGNVLAHHNLLPQGWSLKGGVGKFLDYAEQGVSAKDLGEIKSIEEETRHDVKAVEYFLRRHLEEAGASQAVSALVHFSCTSEDVNNLSYALMLKRFVSKALLPQMTDLIDTISEMVEKYAATAMVARTHGQTASPTTMGKELAVFGWRLKRQRDALAKFQFTGKMNGAVGNYNAHQVAFPELDWDNIARSFVEQSLGLEFNPLTTQIENHDNLVEFFDLVHRFNQILLGFCRDIWGYISIGYFAQKPRKSEVGSSTMPHKVNPIDFENAEGNLGLANSLASHFAEKLPVSRWQRDLSDSTVLRNIGVMLGHSMLAYQSTMAGLAKLTVNSDVMKRDLDGSWEVLSEAVQTVMRRYGVIDAYERLKEATRGQKVTQETLNKVIDRCAELPEKEKRRLQILRPNTYIGLSEQLAREFLGVRSGSRQGKSRKKGSLC